MAKTDKAPMFVRVGNVLTTALLRAGFKFNGLGLKNHPTYLFTVRGRKSGQPRTIPIVIIEQNGQRYLNSPFGMVNWVRNLQAAGEAILTRGHHSDKGRAIELPFSEASSLLKRILEDGIRSFLQQYFEVTANSSREEFERTVVRHPVFSLHEC